MKKIIRVFPRKTNATPVDDNVRFGNPGLFDEADEVHISVTFSWDLDRAERLAEQWRMIAPVKIGGPATDECMGEFTPGMYLKEGYLITSRGCPNKCWFCGVWKKFGDVVELEIKDGWNVLDDNLLACSESHIRNVFKILKKQDKWTWFTGGLEAKRLEEWHIDLLLQIKLESLFFAYDTLDDFEFLINVSKMLKRADIIKLTSHVARCFVLIGYSTDTFKDATKRLVDVMELGYMPMAMLYREKNYRVNGDWMKFQNEWANPIIVGSKMKSIKL